MVQENTKALNNLQALHTYAFNVVDGPEDGLTATKREDQAFGRIELHPFYSAPGADFVQRALQNTGLLWH